MKVMYHIFLYRLYSPERNSEYSEHIFYNPWKISAASFNKQGPLS